MNGDKDKNIFVENEPCAGVSDAESGEAPQSYMDVDRLLRMVSDAETAGIDFASIKDGALAGARKRAARRRRIRYLLATAATMLVCLGLASVLFIAGGSGEHGGHDKDILNSAHPSIDPNMGSTLPPDRNDPARNTDVPKPDKTSVPLRSPAPLQYTRCKFVGVSDSADFDKIVDIIPLALPEYMNTLVDKGAERIASKGTDADGEEKYVDCTMVETPPYALEVGQAGAIECNESIVLYWQLNEESCLKVSFCGFETGDADTLFDDVSRRIQEN